MDLLLVEDSPTDRMVMQARLRHAFPAAQIREAGDPLQLNEHLECDTCDVVVTDYWLGWSDGLSVLQRVRERWPRSRVIMLTGNGGEEVVAGAFKHGLYHYLLKPDGFDDLAAVTTAAMESKRREDLYGLMAMIFNSIVEGVFCVDADGSIAAINAAAGRLFGYSNSEIVGRSSDVLIPVGSRDEVRRQLRRAFGGEVVPRFPTVQLRSDGAEIEVAMSLLPMRDGERNVSAVACIATEIGKTPREATNSDASADAQDPKLSLGLNGH